MGAAWWAHGDMISAHDDHDVVIVMRCDEWSSDPESHPKVGFESVSGFGFRVSGFVA